MAEAADIPIVQAGSWFSEAAARSVRARVIRWQKRFDLLDHVRELRVKIEDIGGSVMIHHVSLGTNDAARAVRFYDPVLAVIGISRRSMEGGSVGYGSAAHEYLFALERPVDGKPATVGNGVHIAFAAAHRTVVDEFYRVALANGGTDDGAPGLRLRYDGNYYGAFVRDLDGNKIEIVTYSAS